MNKERQGLYVGRIAGIGIHFDWSLLIIFALVVVSLGGGYLPSIHDSWPLAVIWATAFAAGVFFFASVLLHELSHALVGRAVGVPVKRITLFLFGGLAQMEGGPKTPRAELAMTIVGPITSIALGVVFSSLGVALAPAGFETLEPTAALKSVGPVSTLFLWLGSVNLALGVFNMIPGFPLDGGRVLRAGLWWLTDDQERATRWASMLGRGFGWTLMGTGVLMFFGVVVPLLGGGFVSGLWLVMIGWFLSNAARSSYEALVVKNLLADVSVEKLMKRHVQMVPADLSIASFVESFVMEFEQRSFPVMNEHGLGGLICIDDIRNVPRDRWDDVRVREVMTPAHELTTIAVDDDAHAALTELGRRDVDQLPVVDVEDGAFVGLIRRKDIIRWMSLSGTVA